jgi:hypothetical protein
MISIYESLKFVFPPEEANDKQLLEDHHIVHMWWTSVQHKRLKDSKTGKIIDKNEVIRRHELIVQEMIKRKFNHYYKSSLDDTLSKKLKLKTIYL